LTSIILAFIVSMSSWILEWTTVSNLELGSKRWWIQSVATAFWAFQLPSALLHIIPKCNGNMCSSDSIEFQEVDQ
jgi:hypothetical protein